MINERVAEIIRRAERSSFLLGQISGQLHTIMQLDEPNAKKAIKVLWDHVMQSIEKIYYSEQKQEIEDKNEI